jgi:hypothetical protein
MADEEGGNPVPSLCALKAAMMRKHGGVNAVLGHESQAWLRKDYYWCTLQRSRYIMDISHLMVKPLTWEQHVDIMVAEQRVAVHTIDPYWTYWNHQGYDNMSEVKRRKIVQREDPYRNINVHHMIEALYYRSYRGEAVDFVELTEARNNYLANQGQMIPYDEEPDV